MVAPDPRDEEVAQKLRKVIDANFDKNTLNTVLAYFAKVADVNIAPLWRELVTAGIDRDAPVTLSLKDVPVAVALKTVLEDLDRGAYYTITEGMVRIRAAEQPRRRQITVQQLLTAVEAALELAAPAEETVQMKYHADTRLLIVRGSKQQLQTIESVIEAVQPRQAGGGRRLVLCES